MHAAEFYYDLLTPHVERIDVWETEYIHVMPGAEAILDWYKGTGLRPYFAALSNAKLAAAGVVMPSWEDALARYVPAALARLNL